MHVIFQPAEAGLGGARAMMEDGLSERFACEAIFAMYNPSGTSLFARLLEMRLRAPA